MLVRKHPMPEIADFVSKLRDAFSDATIDEAVARGKAGEPTFFAQEAGRTVGTKPVDDFNRWAVDGSVPTGTTARVATAHASEQVCDAVSAGDWAGAIRLNLAASSATVFR